jgi:phage shock protein A
MQAKLAEAKRRLGTLSARKKVADLQARMQNGLADPQLNTEAFAKFDRLREKVEMAEAEADAIRELSGAPVREEFDSSMSNENLELEAELLQMKKKLQK